MPRDIKCPLIFSWEKTWEIFLNLSNLWRAAFAFLVLSEGVGLSRGFSFTRCNLETWKFYPQCVVFVFGEILGGKLFQYKVSQ